MKRLNATCLNIAIPLALSLLMLQACASVRDKASVSEFDKQFIVEQNQSLYVLLPDSSIVEKRLLQDAEALLYQSGDTLYADFKKNDLPEDDRRPETLDASDHQFTFFAHHDSLTGEVMSEGRIFKYRFTSLDIDLITVPFKYRLGQQGQESSLIANTNIGGYVGLRIDYGRHRNIHFRRATKSETSTSSLGFGGFVMINSAIINAANTNGQVADEYDGLGVSYGAAGIVGYQSITFGVALGFEVLVDRNAAYWIYNHKPWVGFVIGLNLN